MLKPITTLDQLYGRAVESNTGVIKVSIRELNYIKEERSKLSNACEMAQHFCQKIIDNDPGMFDEVTMVANHMSNVLKKTLEETG